MESDDRVVEWGKEPKDGMIAVGFSTEAVLEGKDLKKKILGLLKQKEVGLREAVKVFINEGLASFDEALQIVKKIKEDSRKKNESHVLNTPYKYSINRMFWAYESDIPKNDPRYFKLNLVDLRKINLEKYQNPDKSFDAKKFIMENISDEEKKKMKRGIRSMTTAIVDSEESSNLDQEWEMSKR